MFRQYATSTPGFPPHYWALTQKGEDANEKTDNEKHCFERQKLKIYVVVSFRGSSQNLERFWAVGHALALLAPPL